MPHNDTVMTRLPPVMAMNEEASIGNFRSSFA
jgi:hypothetical protein